MLKWFGDLSIGKKLASGFLFASLIIVIVGGIGFTSISGFMHHVDDMVKNDLIFLEEAEELEVLTLLNRRYEKDFFLNIGKEEKQKGYIGKFQKTADKTNKLLKKFISHSQSNIHISPEVKQATVDAEKAYNQYKDGFLKLTGTVMADKGITPQEANDLMKSLKKHISI